MVLSITVMLVDLSFAIIHVTVPGTIIQLEVFAALMQVTGSALNMWVTIFIVFMQMGISVAVMQVVLLQCTTVSTVKYRFLFLLYLYRCFQVTISYSFL